MVCVGVNPRSPYEGAEGGVEKGRQEYGKERARTQALFCRFLDDFKHFLHKSI